MKSTLCTLNAELEGAKKMLEYNQTLVSLGDQLYTLKSINKQPPSMAANIFYAMAQALMPRISPYAISLVGGLIVSGLLVILAIN